MNDKFPLGENINNLSFPESSLNSNPQPTDNNNADFENHIDIKKINKIKQLEKSIILDDLTPKKILNSSIPSHNNISDTNNNDLYHNTSKINNKTEKLIKHANFYHTFSEYNVNILDVIPLYFKKDKFCAENGIENNNKISIISDIKKINQDQIEITRIHLYNDFYNQEPYNKERIIISRNVKNPDDPLLISFYEDQIKKTVTSFSNDSQFSKVIKFKSYRNANELLFFQNIFYYKMILEINTFYRMLKKLPEKKYFKKESVLYHEYIKNLI